MHCSIVGCWGEAALNGENRLLFLTPQGRFADVRERPLKLEPGLADATPGERVQFERRGYFCADRRDTRPGAPVFNRTVSLRDSWAKIDRQLAGGGR